MECILSSDGLRKKKKCIARTEEIPHRCYEIRENMDNLPYEGFKRFGLFTLGRRQKNKTKKNGFTMSAFLFSHTCSGCKLP